MTARAKTRRSSAEKRHRFSLYYAGWRAAREGRPEEPPPFYDEEDADWWVLGYVEYRALELR